MAENTTFSTLDSKLNQLFNITETLSPGTFILGQKKIDFSKIIGKKDNLSTSSTTELTISEGDKKKVIKIAAVHNNRNKLIRRRTKNSQYKKKTSKKQHLVQKRRRNMKKNPTFSVVHGRESPHLLKHVASLENKETTDLFLNRVVGRANSQKNVENFENNNTDQSSAKVNKNDLASQNPQVPNVKKLSWNQCLKAPNGDLMVVLPTGELYTLKLASKDLTSAQHNMPNNSSSEVHKEAAVQQYHPNLLLNGKRANKCKRIEPDESSSKVHNEILYVGKHKLYSSSKGYMKKKYDSIVEASSTTSSNMSDSGKSSNDSNQENLLDGTVGNHKLYSSSKKYIKKAPCSSSSSSYPSDECEINENQEKAPLDHFPSDSVSANKSNAIPDTDINSISQHIAVSKQKTACLPTNNTLLLTTNSKFNQSKESLVMGSLINHIVNNLKKKQSCQSDEATNSDEAESSKTNNAAVLLKSTSGKQINLVGVTPSDGITTNDDSKNGPIKSQSNLISPVEKISNYRTGKRAPQSQNKKDFPDFDGKDIGAHKLYSSVKTYVTKSQKNLTCSEKRLNASTQEKSLNYETKDQYVLTCQNQSKSSLCMPANSVAPQTSINMDYDIDLNIGTTEASYKQKVKPCAKIKPKTSRRSKLIKTPITVSYTNSDLNIGTAKVYKRKRKHHVKITPKTRQSKRIKTPTKVSDTKKNNLRNLNEDHCYYANTDSLFEVLCEPSETNDNVSDRKQCNRVSGKILHQIQSSSPSNNFLDLENSLQKESSKNCYTSDLKNDQNSENYNKYATSLVLEDAVNPEINLTTSRIIEEYPISYNSSNKTDGLLLREAKNLDRSSLNSTEHSNSCTFDLKNGQNFENSSKSAPALASEDAINQTARGFIKKSSLPDNSSNKEDDGLLVSCEVKDLNRSSLNSKDGIHFENDNCCTSELKKDQPFKSGSKSPPLVLEGAINQEVNLTTGINKKLPLPYSNNNKEANELLLSCEAKDLDRSSLNSKEVNSSSFNSDCSIERGGNKIEESIKSEFNFFLANKAPNGNREFNLMSGKSLPTNSSNLLSSMFDEEIDSCIQESNTDSYKAKDIEYLGFNLNVLSGLYRNSLVKDEPLEDVEVGSLEDSVQSLSKETPRKKFQGIEKSAPRNLFGSAEPDISKKSVKKKGNSISKSLFEKKSKKSIQNREQDAIKNSVRAKVKKNSNFSRSTKKKPSKDPDFLPYEDVNHGNHNFSRRTRNAPKSASTKKKLSPAAYKKEENDDLLSDESHDSSYLSNKSSDSSPEGLSLKRILTGKPYRPTMVLENSAKKSANSMNIRKKNVSKSKQHTPNKKKLNVDILGFSDSVSNLEKQLPDRSTQPILPESTLTVHSEAFRNLESGTQIDNTCNATCFMTDEPVSEKGRRGRKRKYVKVRKTSKSPKRKRTSMSSKNLGIGDNITCDDKQSSGCRKTQNVLDSISSVLTENALEEEQFANTESSSVCNRRRRSCKEKLKSEIADKKKGITSKKKDTRITLKESDDMSDDVNGLKTSNRKDSKTINKKDIKDTDIDCKNVNKKCNTAAGKKVIQVARKKDCITLDNNDTKATFKKVVRVADKQNIETVRNLRKKTSNQNLASDGNLVIIEDLNEEPSSINKDYKSSEMEISKISDVKNYETTKIENDNIVKKDFRTSDKKNEIMECLKLKSKALVSKNIKQAEVSINVEALQSSDTTSKKSTTLNDTKIVEIGILDNNETGGISDNIHGPKTRLKSRKQDCKEELAHITLDNKSPKQKRTNSSSKSLEVRENLSLSHNDAIKKQSPKTKKNNLQPHDNFSMHSESISVENSSRKIIEETTGTTVKIPFVYLNDVFKMKNSLFKLNLLEKVISKQASIDKDIKPVSSIRTRSSLSLTEDDVEECKNEISSNKISNLNGKTRKRSSKRSAAKNMPEKKELLMESTNNISPKALVDKLVTYSEKNKQGLKTNEPQISKRPRPEKLPLLSQTVKKIKSSPRNIYPDSKPKEQQELVSPELDKDQTSKDLLVSDIVRQAQSIAHKLNSDLKKQGSPKPIKFPISKMEGKKELLSLSDNDKMSLTHSKSESNRQSMSQTMKETLLPSPSKVQGSKPSKTILKSSPVNQRACISNKNDNFKGAVEKRKILPVLRDLKLLKSTEIEIDSNVGDQREINTKQCKKIEIKSDLNNTTEDSCERKSSKHRPFWSQPTDVNVFDATEESSVCELNTDSTIEVTKLSTGESPIEAGITSKAAVGTGSDKAISVLSNQMDSKSPTKGKLSSAIIPPKKELNFIPKTESAQTPTKMKTNIDVDKELELSSQTLAEHKVSPLTSETRNRSYPAAKLDIKIPAFSKNLGFSTRAKHMQGRKTRLSEGRQMDFGKILNMSKDSKLQHNSDVAINDSDKASSIKAVKTPRHTLSVSKLESLKERHKLVRLKTLKESDNTDVEMTDLVSETIIPSSESQLSELKYSSGEKMDIACENSTENDPKPLENDPKQLENDPKQLENDPKQPSNLVNFEDCGTTILESVVKSTSSCFDKLKSYSVKTFYSQQYFAELLPKNKMLLLDQILEIESSNDLIEYQFPELFLEANIADLIKGYVKFHLPRIISSCFKKQNILSQLLIMNYVKEHLSGVDQACISSAFQNERENIEITNVTLNLVYAGLAKLFHEYKKKVVKTD